MTLPTVRAIAPVTDKFGNITPPDQRERWLAQAEKQLVQRLDDVREERSRIALAPYAALQKGHAA